MSILAHLEQKQDSNRRGSARRRLRLETEGTVASDAHAKVVIHDISRTGLLIETTAALPIGSRLEVQIPEAGAVDASIVWRSGRYFGCRFAQPISRAALSAALLRSPAPAGSEDRGRSNAVAEALHEIELLSARVQLLTATVDDAIARFESEPRVSLPSASAPSPDPAGQPAQAAEEEEREEVDTRLSFAMRTRIILALAIASWALILWLAGVL